MRDYFRLYNPIGISHRKRYNMNYFFQNNSNKSKSLEDSYYHLKYFYHINIDELISNCTEKLKSYIMSDNKFEYIFHSVFDLVFEATKPYNVYLSNSTRYHGETFFGEHNIIPSNSLTNRPSTSYTISMQNLIYISLRNHCILHGIMNIARESCNTSLKITGANHSCYQTDSLKVSSEYQHYTNRYNYYHTQQNSHWYSHQILQNMNPSETEKTLSREISNDSYQKYTIPEVFKTFAFFLFNAPAYTIFDKQLIQTSDSSNSQRTTTFMRSYSKLSQSFENYLVSNSCKNKNGEKDQILFSSPLDQLLFCFPIEYFYGFSTFRSIAQTIENIHNSTGNLKYLEGEMLLEILKQVNTLPNVYSRSFFIKYAVEAVTSVTNPVPFLSEEYNPNRIIDFIHFMDPKDYIRNNGMQQLNNYFRSLSMISIPLLEEIWDVTLNKLFGNNKDQLRKVYFDYVNCNYNLLTADFTQIDNDTIRSFCSNSFYDFDFEKFKKCIAEQKNIISTNYMEFRPNTRTSLRKIMLHYFNLNNFEAELPPTLIPSENFSLFGDDSKLKEFLLPYIKLLFTYHWK